MSTQWQNGGFLLTEPFCQVNFLGGTNVTHQIFWWVAGGGVPRGTAAVPPGAFLWELSCRATRKFHNHKSKNTAASGTHPRCGYININL